MYEERDLAPGRQIVECFKPFLHHLLSSNLSRRTLHRHRDNLWSLGGKIISDLNEDESLGRRPIEDLVFAAVDRDGGPWIADSFSEAAQQSFDATCRKLHRFLESGKGIAL
jgi:hypothetical protein